MSGRTLQKAFKEPKSNWRADRHQVRPGVEVRGPRDAVANFLREQPEFVRVEARPADGELTTFEIATRGGRDLREELARRLSARGWGIRRLDVRRVSLEALFTGVVMRGRETAPATAPAA